MLQVCEVIISKHSSFPEVTKTDIPFSETTIKKKPLQYIP